MWADSPGPLTTRSPSLIVSPDLKICGAWESRRCPLTAVPCMDFRSVMVTCSSYSLLGWKSMTACARETTGQSNRALVGEAWRFLISDLDARPMMIRSARLR